MQSRIESSLEKGFNVYEAQQFLNLAVSSLMRETLMKLKSLPKSAPSEGLHPALANQDNKDSLSFLAGKLAIYSPVALLLSGGIVLRKASDKINQ